MLLSTLDHHGNTENNIPIVIISILFFNGYYLLLFVRIHYVWSVRSKLIHNIKIIIMNSLRPILDVFRHLIYEVFFPFHKHIESLATQAANHCELKKMIGKKKGGKWKAAQSVNRSACSFLMKWHFFNQLFLARFQKAPNSWVTLSSGDLTTDAKKLETRHLRA